MFVPRCAFQARISYLLPPASYVQRQGHGSFTSFRTSLGAEALKVEGLAVHAERCGK